MRTSAIVLSLFACLTAGLLVGCGSSGSSSTATDKAATTTVPDGRLSASSAPVKLGYYAGMDCGSSSSCPTSFYTSAESTFQRAKEGYVSHCKGGTPKSDSHSSFTDSHGNEFNYVCFTAVGPTNSVQMKNFYYAGQKIQGNAHVGSDRWPETCEAGYCTSGEWFGTSAVNGKIRNPNHVYAAYRAVWIGS